MTGERNSTGKLAKTVRTNELPVTGRHLKKNTIMKNFESSPEAGSEDLTPANNDGYMGYFTPQPSGNHHPITGLRSIDDIIYGLCPEIKGIDQSKMQILGGLISIYCFDGMKDIIPIQNITNEDTADFIEGIAIIINESNIAHFGELQEYFNDFIEDFNPIEICEIQKII